MRAEGCPGRPSAASGWRLVGEQVHPARLKDAALTLPAVRRAWLRVHDDVSPGARRLDLLLDVVHEVVDYPQGTTMTGTVA